MASRVVIVFPELLSLGPAVVLPHFRKDSVQVAVENHVAAAGLIATKLTRGYHVFFVLGMNAEGSVLSSDPVMRVVRGAVEHGRTR